MRSAAWVLCKAACLSPLAACRAADTPAPQIAEPARAEETSSRIPEAARQLVWQRMQGHGADMTMLLWSLLFLDYEGTTELSRSIVEPPRLARPIDDSTLNAQIPSEFFALQDQLIVRAEHLAELAAAPSRDVAAIARAYGQLTETCVRCHSTFLYEREPLRSRDELAEPPPPHAWRGD
jgi:hypothetical protein